MKETLVEFLGPEDPLEKEMACIIMGVGKSDVCRTNQLAANSDKS